MAATLLMGMVVGFHAFFFDLVALIFLGHLAIVALLYNVPTSSKTLFAVPLRSIPFLKVFLIAYVWTSMSSIFPALIGAKSLLETPVLELGVAHFCFVLAITLPFDIRDVYRDANANLPTIPQLLGISRTKVVAIVSLAIFYITLYQKLNQLFFTCFALSVVGLILGAKPTRKPIYFLLFMDGSIILYYLVVMLSLRQNFSL